MMRWHKNNPHDLARCVVGNATSHLRPDNALTDVDLIGQPDHYLRLLKRIYDALVGEAITYVPEPYHPAEAIQRVRPPAAILRPPREGTCLDLVALFCGLCLDFEMLPTIVIMDGHAIAVVSITHGLQKWNSNRPGREGFEQRPLEDAAILRKLIDDGGFVAVECTGFTGAEVHARDPSRDLVSAEGDRPRRDPLTFEQALVAGRAQLDRRLQRFFAIDLAIARFKWRIEPHKYDEETGRAFSQQSCMRAITTAGLVAARQQATLTLRRLRQARDTTSRTNEVQDFINENSLLGSAPQWSHLYLQEFGAFSRPEKEEQILAEIDKRIGELAADGHGVILHVISGDSGAGKSTLARLLLRRIVEQTELADFAILREQKLRVFELEQPSTWANLESDVPDALAVASLGELALIFFDDLFALEEGGVDAILTALTTTARTVPIYFLVTSPSWIFDRSKELHKRKQTFHIRTVETIVGGMSLSDREALKSQYLTMYGDRARPELLAEIDREDAIILVKLGLHHGMVYSKYLEDLLNRLERREQRYLAALLLFSILARFYVHFPMPLLKRINQDLPSDKRLFEDLEGYEIANYSGLKLFRVRPGTRDPLSSSGMPDTIAPFHDRVAEMILNGWGTETEIPIFGYKLRHLQHEVYRRLDEDPQSRPVLAKVFRGHLRVANDRELDLFVRQFGPVRGNDWVFLGAPLAASRWIFYASNSQRTRQYRRTWELALQNSIGSGSWIEVALALASLNPGAFRSLPPSVSFERLSELGADYSPLILGTLDQILSLSPPPIPVLENYTAGLVEWLEAHPTTFNSRPTPYYSVLICLKSSFLLQRGKRLDGYLGQTLSRIAKGYLLNLPFEYANEELFVSSGLIRIVRYVFWSVEDVEELTEVLARHISQEQTRFKPALAEIVFSLCAILAKTPVKQLFQMFVDVCKQDPSFRGLTYVAETFKDYLWRYGRNYPDEQMRFLAEVLASLSDGQLDPLTNSAAYPDFAALFVEQLGITRLQVTPVQVLRLLRPLLLDQHIGVAPFFVFTAAVRLNLRTADFDQLISDRDSREIALCFARLRGKPIDETLAEFLSLLEEDQVKLASPLALLIGDYARAAARSQPPAPNLEEPVAAIYSWLLRNKERQEAPFVFVLLATSPLLELTPVAGLETLAAASISKIPRQLPHRVFPLEFVRRWLSSRGVLDDQNGAENLLLDAFWQYVLDNCYYHTTKGPAANDVQYPLYDNHFVLLVTEYPLSENASWWLQALRSALELYARLASDISRPDRQYMGSDNKQKRVVGKEKGQRDFLDKVIPTILRQFEPISKDLPETATGDLRRIFAQYEGQPWVTAWLTRLDDQFGAYGSQSLLNYLMTRSGRPTHFFNIRNNIDWWLRWIKESGRDLTIELKTVLEGAKLVGDSGLFILTLSCLLRLVAPHIEDRDDSTQLVFGSWVWDAIADQSADFLQLSELIREYLSYVQLHSLPEKSFISHERQYVSRIATWYLLNVTNDADRDGSSYGLQILFETLTKLGIPIELQVAEAAFLSVSAAHLDRELGGPIARSFFGWLPVLAEPVSPELYINFVAKYELRNQASFIMAHMIAHFNRASIQLSLEERRQCWSILKRMAGARLALVGTTVAAQALCQYFVALTDNTPGHQEFLRQMAVEGFALVEQMVYHQRAFILAAALLPVWSLPAAQVAADRVLRLWEALLNRFTVVENIEVFGKFTREILKYIAVQEDQNLVDELCNITLAFVNQRPDHEMSVKLCSILAQEGVAIDSLAEVLPNLITCQRVLLDASYAIERFAHNCASKLDDDARTAFERALILTLQRNLHKPFAERCLKELIKGCQPVIHRAWINQLFQSYLRKGQETGRGLDKLTFRKVFHAYYKYEQRGDQEAEDTKQDLSTLFRIIRESASNQVSIYHLDALLDTYPAEDIACPEAVTALAAVLGEADAKHWQLLVDVCQRYSDVLGDPFYLMGDLSSHEVLAILNKDEEQGLIVVRQMIKQRSRRRSQNP